MQSNCREALPCTQPAGSNQHRRGSLSLKKEKRRRRAD